MTEHTPGPWRVSAYDGGWTCVREATPNNGIVAKLGISNEANARLIAAAPELLEALQMVMQHGRIDDSESRMNMVAAAIIKATGGAP